MMRTDLPLLIFAKADTPRFGGCSGLHRMNWVVAKFEIGYWCRKSREGQGLITEAVCGLTAFARRELDARRLETRQNAAKLPNGPASRPKVSCTTNAVRQAEHWLIPACTG